MTIDLKELESFLNDIYKLYFHDFRDYNKGTITRRIKAHSIKLGVSTFDEYKKIVLRDNKYFNEMFENFSINVTEFFRELDKFEFIYNELFNYLSSFVHLKIWCAGCSTGEDAFSLALLLNEKKILEKSQIYATDFNQKILAQAKKGRFKNEDLKDAALKYRLLTRKEDFFSYFHTSKNYLQISPKFREKILFFNHNLVLDSVMNEFQLIICKNVLIYFNTSLKQKIFDLFYDSLTPNGFLVLGDNEFLTDSITHKFRVYNSKYRIYQKI